MSFTTLLDLPMSVESLMLQSLRQQNSAYRRLNTLNNDSPVGSQPCTTLPGCSTRSCLANQAPSSKLTSRRSKSHLLPMSMITIFLESQDTRMSHNLLIPTHTSLSPAYDKKCYVFIMFIYHSELHNTSHHSTSDHGILTPQHMCGIHCKHLAPRDGCAFCRASMSHCARRSKDARRVISYTSKAPQVYSNAAH